MPRICENEDELQSSGDGVETEGEEEDILSAHNSTTKDREDIIRPQSLSDEGEQLTPYVAKCFGHLETLRKRKREQEERVETLVEETFGQIEAIMQEMMRELQERHAASHAQFETADNMLARSLHMHNRVRATLMARILGFVNVLLMGMFEQTEKKLKMIAAILLHEDSGVE